MKNKEKVRIYEAQQIVEKFNRIYPIGSKVLVKRNSTKSCPVEEVTVKGEALYKIDVSVKSTVVKNK